MNKDITTPSVDVRPRVFYFHFPIRFSVHWMQVKESVLGSGGGIGLDRNSSRVTKFVEYLMSKKRAIEVAQVHGRTV